MSESQNPEIKFAAERYGAGITSFLRRDFEANLEAENAELVQVERGAVLHAAMTTNPMRDHWVERLVVLALAGGERHVKVVDRLGHQRAVYRPLLIYAWLLAFKLEYERLPREAFGRWEEALRPWCDALEASLVAPFGPEVIPATSGAAAGEAAWTALALHQAGKLFIRDAWVDLAADTFGRITRLQQSNGAFLAASGAEHPESTWYHELQILHAAASYAVQAEDRTIAGAVERATEFHQRQTQPDHATTQPWGLFAFIWNTRTRPLADQLLHATALGELDGVSLILLCDSLYCLRLFL